MTIDYQLLIAEQLYLLKFVEFVENAIYNFHKLAPYFHIIL